MSATLPQAAGGRFFLEFSAFAAGGAGEDNSLRLTTAIVAIVSVSACTANAERSQLPNLVPQGWVQVYADIGTKTRRFVSPDAEATLTSSETLAHRDKLKKDMDGIAYHGGERITYQRRAASWIAVSGYRADRIFYRKSNLACDGTRWHNIELEYSIEAKRQMEAPVTQIAHDMGLYREDCASND